jgi:D-alanyl-D-alanine carboxypeptidase
MKNTLVFSGIILLLLTYCSTNSESQALKESFENRLEELVLQNDLPGINFSIIYPDGDQFDCSAGFADTEKEILLDTEHVMFSGSIGKTYAVAVLMQLFEEGKIDLDARYLSYFPETGWLTRLPNIELITVRQLLEHTSGLPRYIENQSLWDSLYVNPDKVWSYEDRLSFIFDMGPVHDAGDGWAYSDSNYLLIGMLIEEIADSPYYSEVRSRILESLDLQNTYPGITREIKNLPMGYSRLGPFFRMPEIVVENGKYAFNPQMEWTGGGFASTTSDLARWANAYFSAKCFSTESLTQITSINPNGKNISNGMSYGMGSFIFDTKYGRMWGHTGFMPGFVSIFGYLPEKSIALALQINCDYASNSKSLERYLEDILEVSFDN